MTGRQGWVSVGDAAELAEDQTLAANVAGQSVAVYRSGGCLYATANVCSHGQAQLSDGWLEDGVIECPLHGGRFDVVTGKGLGAPIEEDLRTYPARERDGRIEVLAEEGES